MTLSNVEHQVLALICDEHRQTHRGAKIPIIYAGMGATTYQQKARIVDVLHSLKNRGRLALGVGPDVWVPVNDARLSLHNQSIEPKPTCFKCTIELCEFDAKQYGHICNDCFKQLTADSEAEAQEYSSTVERIGAPLPDELLNRCAAMNAVLLAQAEKAHSAGDPEAWRDLAWLIETGKQLVAAGGES
ncbi:hypothetical protein [Halomonas halocynthiae]|uniref:hypothetical protein n=1 Tax=Halomonas halocynthiae TaxID=176290 RepID=UPI00041ED231|nr:hypothetical protein [Halomonas halocynthiae]